MNASEAYWHEVKITQGWELPSKAHWFWRLPIIRRFRAAYTELRVEEHYQAMPGLRTGYDEWVIYAIKRGWC